MRYEGVTVFGKAVSLPAPISVKIRMDEDAPAHSFTGIFPVDTPLVSFLTCRIWRGDELVFRGILDEQSVCVEKSGMTLRLVARSEAALLLDNEALPQTYVNPSLKQLFDRHAAPYGLAGVEGNQGAFRGKLTVKKGMSEWQVFEEFCGYFLGTTPRVTCSGILDATGKPSEKQAFFSNQGGIPYRSLIHHQWYHKRISQLHLQAGVGEGYKGLVTDVETAEMGIQRRRYRTATNYMGNRSLKIARRSAEEWVLCCPSPLVGELGAHAQVSDPALGTINGVTVAKLAYQLDSRGELCNVTLRKEEWGL
ncbi:MAG: hypothetical protein HFJ84_02260 [Clostridiales bacterium]|jgi:hypothetical protein|nr:hypothetical protein [Clostridiales bacterium]